MFWATVGLGLFALAAVLTGDLLSWDQNGYAATKTRTGFLTFLPWVGDSLLKIAIGGPGPALGSLSLTRFFAMHVGLFGGGFLAAVDRSRRAGPAGQREDSCRQRGSCTGDCCGSRARRSPIGPLKRGAARRHVWSRWRWFFCWPASNGVRPPHAGAPLLSPADTNPLNAYDAARPEWFLVGVYEFSHLFPGEWGIVPIFIVPGLLVLIVLAMPFVGKHPIGQGFNVLFTVLLLGGVVWLTYHSYAKDRADPAHQKAIAVERWRADRVCELIRHNQGIPPSGALSLLQHDPKAEGPRLFAQQCASCHNHAVPGGDEEHRPEHVDREADGAESRRLRQPPLDRRPARSQADQRAELLRRHEAPRRRHARLRERDVRRRRRRAEEEHRERSWRPCRPRPICLPRKRSMPKDAKIIEEGRKLMVDDFGCTNCHKFHEKGSAGSAPELTGYGSPEWIAGIVRNPASRRFYGKLNDRMPAYAASDDPTQNTLTAEQIKLLADWLRGDWYEGKMMKDD